MSATMAKKKNPTGQSQPDRHKNPMVGLRLEPDVLAALQAYAHRQHRSVAQSAAFLLMEKMRQEGLLPPLPSQETGHE
jgi:hypothetical protein